MQSMLRLLLALAGLAALMTANAGQICVSNSAGLQTALLLATLQSQPYAIKLEQGAYALSGDLQFAFSAPTSLLGGYAPGSNCDEGQRTVTAGGTAIDLGGSTGVLTLTQLSASPRAGITLEALTIADGHALSLTTGQYHPILANDPGDLTLQHVHLYNLGLAGSDTRTPIYLQAEATSSRLEDVLIESIPTAGTDNCSVYVYLDDDSYLAVNYTTIDLSGARDFCVNDGITQNATYQTGIYNSIIWASDGTLSALHGVGTLYHAAQFSFVIDSSIVHTYYGGGSASFSNNVAADPKWVNPGVADYRLQAASPAVNSGNILDPFGNPASDVAGNKRWVGSHPDRGAYESPYSDQATFVVTSAADSGPNTLRQAIIDANSLPNAASITFSIPLACPAVINLLGSLPAIASPIAIDGYSQPGSSVNTDPVASNAKICIVLEAASGTLATGLRVPSGNSAASLVVRGVGFGGFGQGILLLDGANHVIAGNQFGGVVGGTALAGASLQAISIGVNAGGSLIVGGQAYADRNVIGGGGFYGINVQAGVDSTPALCQIVGNLIGVAANGVTPIANFTGLNAGGNGCLVSANRIVGNTSDAITISGSGNIIQRNVIGVDANGDGAINSGYGVRIAAGNDNVIGIDETSGISGTLLANTVRYMVAGGIAVQSGTGNAVRSNLVYDNGLSGNGMDIDLGGTGPTPNDADDVDAGANLLQNFALVSGLAYASAPPPGATGVAATLTATLNAQPGAYRIDAYFSNGCAGNGRGHAQAFAGTKSITVALGSTRAAFSVGVLLPNVQANASIALTATDFSGNTSEIGSCVPADTVFRNGVD